MRPGVSVMAVDGVQDYSGLDHVSSRASSGEPCVCNTDKSMALLR
jgi:hypothetical protein